MNQKERAGRRIALFPWKGLEIWWENFKIVAVYPNPELKIIQRLNQTKNLELRSLERENVGILEREKYLKI